MTEPSGGSDVAGLKTRAVRKDDHFHSKWIKDVHY